MGVKGIRMPGGDIDLGLSWQRLVGILVIALLTWVNLRGLREAKWIQTSFTIAKTGALAALILLGITSAATPTPSRPTSATSGRARRAASR